MCADGMLSTKRSPFFFERGLTTCSMSLLGRIELTGSCKMPLLFFGNVLFNNVEAPFGPLEPVTLFLSVSVDDSFAV